MNVFNFKIGNINKRHPHTIKAEHEEIPGSILSLVFIQVNISNLNDLFFSQRPFNRFLCFDFKVLEWI